MEYTPSFKIPENGMVLPEPFRGYRIEDMLIGERAYLGEDAFLIDPEGRGYVIGKEIVNPYVLQTDEDYPFAVRRVGNEIWVDLTPVDLPRLVLPSEYEYQKELTELAENFGEPNLLPAVWMTRPEDLEMIIQVIDQTKNITPLAFDN